MTQRIAEDLIQRRRRLADARRGWETHWQELAEMLLPQRADFLPSRTAGGKRTEQQFDSVPLQAVRALAASIDGLLKPKSSRWFGLKADDPDLDGDDDVKAWLEHVEDRLYAALHEPRSRFAQRTAEVELDLVVFGTGCLYVGERPSRGGITFRSHHLRNILAAENADGEIDTVFRSFTLSARQAVEQFGADQVGRTVKAALAQGDVDRLFRFLHVIQPRPDFDPRRADARALPFASIYVDEESICVVAEGGYQEFPYVVPRWETAADEIYGRSPGMLALPDVKTLNQMGKTILRAGHKVVDPPLLVPDDGITAGPRTYPGGITSYDASILRHLGGRSPIIPLETGANIPLGREMQNDVREQVWSAFFRNVLQLPVPGPQMTATEILERKEEFLRVIGPTFGRLEAEYTAPLIERVFNVLLRAGRFAPMPDVLRGRRLRFEYASPVAKAQRRIEAAALRKTLDDVGPLLNAHPDLLDHLDHEQILKDIASANGVPARWFRARCEVEWQRRERGPDSTEAGPAALRSIERLIDLGRHVGGATGP
ncbi:MAG: portal protein [Alphaproteobacteria bacterium]